jgi:hypothetical protein
MRTEVPLERAVVLNLELSALPGTRFFALQLLEVVGQLAADDLITGGLAVRRTGGPEGQRGEYGESAAYGR